MTTLILKNSNGTIFVEYKLDSTHNVDKFTIMQINDLSDSEITLGMDFKCLTNNLKAFIDFANNNNLDLISIEGNTITTIVDSDDSESISASV